MNDIDRSDIPSARFPNLFSVKTVIEQGKQLAKTYQVTVVALDDIVVKYGRGVYKSEALAMQLVRDAATDVPLSQLHAYFTEMAKDLNGEGRCGYLVMEKVPGIPLIEALPRLDEQSCDNIASQLQTYVSSLRSIDNAGKWGGLFHYLHRPFTKEYWSSGLREPKITESASSIDFSRPSMFFHGDLVPENIMVDEASGSITSIIDWKRAGWYPYFWDESLVSMRLSAYQSARTTSDRWTRIYKLAMGNDADQGAVSAFCGAQFYAFLQGSEEYGSRSP
ncbi:hypothetical protein TRAPUB_6840 [Trametes pubescens]|uniref:Aminoglycoside phosphotransferase domain-containing protein n=1 Tax=Trametes pubescens TaxID=154538 RepID=A0A1M2V4X1_TRAPU|nr:hypothetical protein TRAPUB_6840 [Trametes pubescens]